MTRVKRRATMPEARGRAGMRPERSPWEVSMRWMWCTAVAVILAVGSVAAVEPASEVYGDGVTLDEGVAIPKLLADSGAYVGKKVRVDGVVAAVCQHRGCWMQVTDPQSGQAIRIKVEDGVIVFPASAVGKRASAEGVFEAVTVPSSGSEAVSHEHAEGEAHEAECAGDVVADTIYLIRGTGAVVYETSS